jgi:4-hydroxybenzoate polyprenyltransferase
MDGPDVATGTSTLQAYLRLFRLPNVFTALADVTMGFLFVQSQLRPWPVYAVLAVASVCLYLAGMVLNDVYDVEQDRQERPQRPLPSGAVALGTARLLGLGLLLAGVASGWIAPHVGQLDGSAWRSGYVATLLAACVLAYDAVLKRTPAGPLVMGSCRFLNVLLGMSIGPLAQGPTYMLGFTPYQLVAAAALGTYITGITWFARTEASTSRRSHLAGGTIVAAGGLGLLAWLYRVLPPHVPTMDEKYWFVLIGLLAFVIIRRCSTAIAEPTPQRVQLAVKNALWSLIVLNAAVVLLVCGPPWALAVLALVIPTILLGAWIEAT